MTGSRFVTGLFALVALGTVGRAASAIIDAVANPGGHAALIACYHGLRSAVAIAFALCTVGRTEPQRRARQPLALAACAVAMCAVVAFEAPTSHSLTALVFAGDALAVVSCLWLLAAVLALGRCFGILPEARGLVTRGPYRLVRHPVYLGELGACAGLALTSPSLRNAIVLAALAIAQRVRMSFEERALASAFTDYLDYASRTPRLIPSLAVALDIRLGGISPLSRSRFEISGIPSLLLRRTQFRRERTKMQSSLKDRRFNTPKLLAGDERGETLVEYALILLFVSTALVLTLGGLTTELQSTFEGIVAAF